MIGHIANLKSTTTFRLLIESLYAIYRLYIGSLWEIYGLYVGSLWTIKGFSIEIKQNRDYL